MEISFRPCKFSCSKAPVFASEESSSEARETIFSLKAVLDCRIFSLPTFILWVDSRDVANSCDNWLFAFKVNASTMAKVAAAAIEARFIRFFPTAGMFNG